MVVPVKGHTCWRCVGIGAVLDCKVNGGKPHVRLQSKAVFAIRCRTKEGYEPLEAESLESPLLQGMRVRLRRDPSQAATCTASIVACLAVPGKCRADGRATKRVCMMSPNSAFDISETSLLFDPKTSGTSSLFPQRDLRAHPSHVGLTAQTKMGGEQV